MLDRFDAPGMTVAALTRRCQRVASLRGDGVALFWLTLESTDVANKFTNQPESSPESLVARLLKTIPGDEANAKWTAEYDGYISRRQTESGTQQANLRSVQQIEELAQTLPSGQSLWRSRVQWATQYLYQARAIIRPRRGVFTITDRGRALLAAHPARVGNEHLEEFEEFPGDFWGILGYVCARQPRGPSGVYHNVE